jgi:hypothetical protein
MVLPWLSTPRIVTGAPVPPPDVIGISVVAL